MGPSRSTVGEWSTGEWFGRVAAATVHVERKVAHMTTTASAVGKRIGTAPWDNSGLRDRLPEEPVDRRAVELELQRLVFVRHEEPKTRRSRRLRQRRVLAAHAKLHPVERRTTVAR